MPEDTILIGHGAGGKLSRDLINQVFIKHFNNSELSKLDDCSLVNTTSKTAFTTDSYVIDPIIFPGGDIGKLAVSGTVNDLLVGGAIPQYLSAGFILEEGLPIEILEQIVASMAKEARKAHVKIITGDTKVVKKGQCDKLFINTAGIGKGMEEASHLWEPPVFNIGDKVIVSGYLGDHATTILAARNNISFEQELVSDVAPLNNLIIPLMEDYSTSVKFMRDIT
ncbi:MAG TPA: hydrogenase expression/formation protein HypE, partial [Bacteroidales bacterium]|nr:hydrogenase expression/formation protein HypE [Bacteroidales bacterium]